MRVYQCESVEMNCAPLRALRNGLLRSHQSAAEDGPGDWFFTHQVHVHDVIPRRQRITKRQFLVPSVLLQGKMLVSDRGRTSNVIDRQHNEREIEITACSVRHFYRAINAISVYLRFVEPVGPQRGLNGEREFLRLAAST